MPLSRRQFIVQSGLLLSSAALANSCSDRENSQQTTLSPDEWATVRRQFDLSPSLINLSALYLASHPTPVRAAIEKYRAGLNDNPVDYLLNEIDQREEEVLKSAGNYLNANSEDIALTDSTTMGLGLVYNGLRLNAGQEILTTEQDYYATHESLRLAAEKTGATVTKISLFNAIEQATEDKIIESIRSAIKPTTRVVALTWVHSSTGLKLPLAQIAEVIKGINNSRDERDHVLLSVDAVHGFGVEDVEVDDLGCDFFIAGCHKWLFGPRGTGIIWASKKGWAAVSPTIPSFTDGGSRSAWLRGDEPIGRTNGRRMSPGGFKAYEYQWALAEAFKFHQQIGKARIAARTHELSRQLKEGLAKMRHIRLYTPLDDKLSAGIVCFDVNGKTPAAVVDSLRERKIIATVTPYATAYVRLCPSIYNSHQEIEVALKELERMA